MSAVCEKQWQQINLNSAIGNILFLQNMLSFLLCRWLFWNSTNFSVNKYKRNQEIKIVCQS